MSTPEAPAEQSRQGTLAPRSCAFCDKRFTPKRATQVYCSTNCRRRGKQFNRLITPPELTDRRCEWCGNRLESTNPKAKFCCDSCRLSAFKAKPCFYCGAPATTRDHFIPRAFRRRLESFMHVRKTNILLPACIECNSTAGAEVFHTTKEKRYYILKQYQSKYRKLLEAPYWTQEEIDELGPTLQSHIKRSAMEQDFIRRRMRRLSR